MSRLEEALGQIAEAAVQLEANGQLRALGFTEKPVFAVYAPGELEEEDLPSRWVRQAIVRQGSAHYGP